MVLPNASPLSTLNGDEYEADEFKHLGTGGTVQGADAIDQLGKGLARFFTT
jgi:hypothetical protein